MKPFVWGKKELWIKVLFFCFLFLFSATIASADLYIRSAVPSPPSTVFTDESGSGHTVTAYGNTHHAAYGNDTCIHFDGTGDYLSLAHSADWDFGTDNFTIDLWVNFTAAPSQNDGIFGSNRVVNWQFNGYVISYLDGAIQWQHSGTGTINTGITPVVGEWYHLAVVRSGGDLTFYVNGGDAATGAKVTKTIGSAAINSAGDGLLISRLRRQITGFEPACYMDEIRVTRSALWEDNFTPPNPPHIFTCSYSIDPVSASVAAEGATGSTVAVTASNSACEWTATSNEDWITVVNYTGTGNGTVTYDVAANTALSARSGSITIAGEMFSVNQEGEECAYAIDPESASVSADGATGSTVAVTVSNSACEWTAVSNDGWISITGGASGAGDGTVTYDVAANEGLSARSGTMTIAGKTFTVNQDGEECLFTIDPESASVGVDGVTGNAVSVGASNQACEWTAVSNDAWISITGGASGTGDGTVIYSVSANPGAVRSGTMSIAGKTFTVNQDGLVCTFSIDPESASVGAGGVTSNEVNVTASNSACEWTAVSNDAWISITGGASGTGDGTVTYDVAANEGLSARSGTMTIAGKTFTVDQDAKGPEALYIYSATTPSSTVFTDESGSGHTVTAYGNTHHAAYGNDTCIHFDGTGDYLSLAHSADWDFGTDDFTIDLWVNFTAAPSQNDGIFGSNRVVNWQLNGYVISYLDGAIQWQHSGTGTINTGITPVVGEWYHLAVVRSGGDLTFYVNGGDAATGAKVTKTIGSAAINSAGDGLLISRLRRQITGFEPACYMDEIRVTRSALWEDNFTPPNAPFFEFDYAVYIDNNPQNGSFDPGELFFDTIQEAIDAASPGDVIQVLSGTYEEQLYINKSVELRGPNYGVNPNTQVRNPEATIRYPATDAWWALVYIDGDGDESTTTSDVTIDGFTLNGADYYGDMTELIFVAGANNVAIKNNRFQNFESIALRFYHQYYDGASWVTSYPVGAVVADNHISNPDFYSIGSIAPNTGIYLQGVYGSVTGNVVEDVLGGCQIQPYNHPNTLAETGIVSGNTFKACRNALWYNNSSNANADWLFSDNTLVGMGCPAGYTPAADWYGEPTDIWYGFAINGNSFGEIEFSGNTITAGTTALPTYGIRYVHGYAHAPASSITGNFIEGLNYGIYLPTDLANVGEIHINNNSITDSIEYGVYNGTTTALDAAYNWWGDDDPSDNASANVDYDPWYLDADMTWLSNQKVHNVTQDTWYETIQDAIDAASMAGGDTIAVAAGTFTENLTVYKSLTLQGAGSAQSVISVSNGIAVEVTADDVTIDGFEIKHSVVDDLADMGIRLNQSNGCIIQNNKINYNSLGLQLLDAGSNQILDNEFLYNAVGIYLEGTTDGEGHFDGGSNGPFYSLSLNNEIDGNIITYSIIMGEQGGDGIYLDAACESNVINNNTITDNAANGYYAWKASNNEITDNTISNNGDNGIHLFGSSGNTVTGNTLEENVNYGFWLRSGALSTTSNEITGNTVTGSGTGICLEDDFSTNNYLGVVTGNTISNNGIYENTDYGMRVIDVNPDDVNLPVDAADNWWGDATGPYHATTNPDGLGNAVSDNVLYEPWTGIIDDSDSVLWIRSDDVDDGVNSFFDVSATGHAVTPYGNAQHRNPVGKDSAIHFDGTGDYLSLAHSADWDFGTDDFTIDLWVNFTAAPSQNDGIFGSNRVVNWQLNGYVISYLDGAIQWQHSGTGTINTGITPVVGEWYHLAVVRSGGDLTFYVNGGDAATGAKVSKTIGSAAINSAGDGLLISRLRRQITGFEPACYMDEIRVTRSALWEDNFTPPNAPATSCLYNIDPTMEDIAAEGAIGNTVDVDASDENCEWTAASNAAWITITGGTSGTGDGTVTYDVAANNDASPRSGAMTIAGETFTVNQAGLDVSGVGAFIDVDGSGSYTVGDAEYTTIQAAINETDPALTGHAIGLLNGDYILTSTLNVNRPVTIFGQSESGVTIDTSDAGITAYGIDISASDVTLENFTLIPPANGTFAIHSGPDGLNQRNDLTLRNITIIGSQRTAFDINGYNGVTLQNLTARDTVYGSGIALSGCTNFDITGCVTEDNAWAGLMFQISNTTGGNCAGSFNMAANTLADGAQVQFPNGFGYTNDVTVSGSTYIIHNPDAPLGVSHSVWGYTDSTDEAMVVAAAVAGNVVNGLNTVWDVADSRYVIAPGLGIQTAIDAAIAGDTIDVGAGIYNEALNISKGITLQGAGYAGTIIDGTGLDAKPLVKITNSSGDVVFDGFTVQNGASSDGTHFQMTVSNGNPGNTVTISNNHIIGSGDDTNDDYGLYSSSGLSDLVFTANTVENCAYHGLFLERYKGATDISANHFTGMAGSVPVGFMTYENPGDADGSQDITEKQWVHDNIIDANGGHGIIVLAPYGMYYNHYKGGSFTNIEISNNIIYNVGDSYGKAIQFEIDSDGGGIYDAVISGNTLSSQTPGTGTSRGIRILAGAVNTQIIGNTITGFNQGVYQSYSWGQPGAVGPTGTVLRNNDISGNLSYGVENQYSDPANTIDATQNWWGDDTGPYHATTNPAGLGSAVSDNVLYDPWTGTLDESVLWIRSNDVDDGVNSFFDVSESGHAVTAYGNAQHRNPVGKDSAIHFDGNGDYLSLAHDEDWDFGTDDFTIDLWVNFTAVPAQYDGIFGSNRIVNWQFNGYMIFYDGSIQWQHSGTGVINSGITPVVGDWYHLAVVRNGSDLTFYVNGGDAATGAKISKTIGTAAINSAGDGLLISRLRRQISGYEPACYMDEIRVTRSALWEDNFTPPNPPFNP